MAPKAKVDTGPSYDSLAADDNDPYTVKALVKGKIN
jgi:hypothetical protein